MLKGLVCGFHRLQFWPAFRCRIMRFSKFRLARLLGAEFFLDVPCILGVWLRTLPAFESDPCVGILLLTPLLLKS